MTQVLAEPIPAPDASLASPTPLRLWTNARPVKPAPEKIEFVDLKRQYRRLQPELDAAIHQVTASGALVGGPFVETFESEWARYCGTRFAVTVSSGTDALFLALRALGVGPGDEVITVPHTFIATVSAIVQTGATPILADIDPATYNLDPADIEHRITPRTKVILPVHIYGQPADMDSIMAIAARHNLCVLEDAAQAHGACYKGRRAGSLGHMAAFSFYPGKNLGAYGDGGAVTTDCPELATKLRRLSDHGRVSKYEHEFFAQNSRLDALQAAVLSVKLRSLECWNERRQEIAARYDAELAGIPGLTVPAVAPEARSVYHLYVIRTEFRAALQDALTAAHIAHGIHYPIPVHLQPAWASAFGSEIGPGAFPTVERYAGEILSLPIHPEMTDTEVERVVRAVRRALAKSAVARLPRYRAAAGG